MDSLLEYEKGRKGGKREVLTTLGTTQRTRRGEMRFLLHKEDQNSSCQEKGSLGEKENSRE